MKVPLAALSAVAIALGCVVAPRAAPAPAATLAYDHGRARMFPVSSLEAWAALNRVLAKNQIDIAAVDESNMFITTIRMGVTWDLFGFGPRDVDDAFATADVQFYLFVSPFAEPARVYVGSIAHGQGPTTLVGGTPTARAMRKYQDDRVGSWLLDQLSAQLGVRSFDIPQDALSRQALARSLTESRPGSCANDSRSKADQHHFAPPQLLRRVEPVFPARSDVRNITIRISGLVQEDGVVWVTDLRSLDLPPQFVAAARGAISLWTYRPAWGDRCMIVAPIEFVANFGKH